MSNTYYGCYRTRTFANIFPDLNTFQKEFNSVQIPKEVSDDIIPTIYYLLYARYGNSHISYTDENQFKYGIFSTIFMYGPSWEKRLDIQKKLRGLTEAEILQGSKAIYNRAYNPSQAPTTSTLEELNYINDQNTTNYKKSKMAAYADLIALIQTDVTERFIAEFKKFFIVVVAPDYPLLYASYPEDYEIDEEIES